MTNSLQVIKTMTELEKARVRRGFSQAKLAELSGVDQATISKAENWIAMGPKAAKKMALYLGYEVSINHLLYPEDYVDADTRKPAHQVQQLQTVAS